MATIKGYKALNLPVELVEELKAWRLAFNAAYGKNVTYADMLRSMIDSLKDSEPAVFAEMERLVEVHPEIGDRLGRFSFEVQEG